jgi:hypothetical protein
MLEVPSSVHPAINVKFSNPRAPFTNINDQGVLGVFGEDVSWRSSIHSGRSTGMRMWLDQVYQ